MFAEYIKGHIDTIEWAIEEWVTWLQQNINFEGKKYERLYMTSILNQFQVFSKQYVERHPMRVTSQRISCRIYFKLEKGS